MTSSNPTRPSPNLPRNPLLELLSSNRCILDVRAESEFEQGSVPNSTNLPILNDQERKRVGTTYKQQGSEAAQRVGHRLISGEVRQARLDAWLDFCREHPDSMLTCWRGGLRSQIAQSWLAESGVQVERIPGGYKALRQACLDVFKDLTGTRDWLVLAGKTGTAKTILINETTHSIDLEGFANHRGSAFGAHISPQPTPATFENALACAFLHNSHISILVEDESRTIGRLALPETWHAAMQQAPLILLEADDAFRIAHIEREYIDDPISQGEPPDQLEARYLSALDRITRRLGGLNSKEIRHLMSEAFADRRSHADWIEALLHKYYDPMYEFQLKKKQDRIVMHGDHDAVKAYLSDRGHAAVQQAPHL